MKGNSSKKPGRILKTEPPKAAIISRWVYGISGATTYILENARRLARSGWTVDIYGERLDEQAIRSAGASPRRLPQWPLGGYLGRRFFAALAARAASRGRYTIVHGNGDGFSQDVLSMHNCVHAAHEAIHGEVLPRNSSVGRMHERILSEKRFRILIANSRLMREDMTHRFGVSKDSIRVVYPGHDPSRFNSADRARWRQETRKEVGCAPGDILFGLITSGDFQKRGVRQFLQALAILRSSGFSAFRAIIMGKEAHPGPYLRLAADLDLLECVRFLPPVHRVERYYHALDVYVHPARYEEFGLSVQEALACGVPVLTGIRVGAAELIPERGREFVLESVDAQALAPKMSLLAANPALRGALGADSSAAVRKNDWDRHFADVLECYRIAAPRPLDLDKA
ncbi:MAG: glycosyltransferase family 4 protein [Elusimicrobiota bacterium]